MKKIMICIGALAATLSASALDIKMYSGTEDTVRSASQIIVGATDPKATVTVNGEDVNVRRTGSFGYKIDLKPGANTVDIKATLDGQTATKNFQIFRTDKARKPVEAKPQTETLFANPFFVQSDSGAYLQYGNGDDRLGGSKMCFIAQGIPMKVVGESNDLYKVALSSQRWAFLPKEYASATTQATSTVCTGSWSVSNEGNYDQISVSLPCRLPYRYYTMLDPSTIVVELYGAYDNSNWITQRSKTLGMVDYVTFEQPESDIYKIIIRLKERYQWGFNVNYDDNRLLINVRHCPADLSLKALTIGLDAGHGGKYPGAISPSGITEKEVNLDIILRLKALLEKAGAKVVLTRDGDTGPSMTERKLIWRDAKVDLAISVHNNWTPDPLSAPGTSTYYKHLFDRPLAEALLGRLLETGLNLYGLTGNFNFSLNGPTDYPNALVEAMFMNSLEEEEMLATPEFRQKLAEKICQGITDYLAAVKAAKKIK